MARSKVDVDLDELQSKITEVESQGLFNSPHKVYEKVAQTEWAQNLGLTPVVVYLRVKEANADPNNPRIAMRTKRARVVSPRQVRDGTSSSPKPKKASKVTFEGIDILVETFKARGVDVTNVSWLMTSQNKSDAQNRAIMLAWADLRDQVGCPKRVKATTVTAGPVEGPPGESDGQGLAGVEVVETLPDGAPVGPPVVPPVAQVAVPVRVPGAPPVKAPVAQVAVPVRVPVAPPVKAPVAQVPVPAQPIAAMAPANWDAQLARSFVTKTDNELHCTECEFTCHDITEADKHESQNPGHLVNVSEG